MGEGRFWALTHSPHPGPHPRTLTLALSSGTLTLALSLEGEGCLLPAAVTFTRELLILDFGLRILD
jgi:hypothetical protein